MLIRLRKTPEYTVIPGHPGSPGRSAFCNTTWEIIGYRVVGGGPAREWCEDPGVFGRRSEVGHRDYESAIASGGMYGVGWTCQSNRQPIYKEHKYCMPAVPPTPPVPNRVVKNANNGWDAGARSVATLGVDEYMVLTVNSNPVAIMIGLSEKGMEFDYANMGHSIVVRAGNVSEVVNGVDVATYNRSVTRIRVIRYADRVEYYADGVKVAQAPMDPSRVVYLYAQLYSDLDDVSGLLKGILARSTATFTMSSSVGVAIGGEVSTSRPLAGGVSSFTMQSEAIATAGGYALTGGTSLFIVSSDAAHTATVIAAAESEFTLIADSYGYGGFGTDSRGRSTTTTHKISGSMVGALAAKGVVYAPVPKNSPNILSGQGRFHSYSLSAYLSRAERIPMEATGFFPLPSISAGRPDRAGISSGSVARATGYLPYKGKGSGLSGVFMGGTIEFRMRPVIGGDIPEVSDNFTNMQDLIGAADFLSMDTVVLFSIFDGVSVSSDIDIYLIVNLAFDEHALVSGDVSFSSVLELIIQEKLRVTPSGSVAQSEAIQYAVNSVTGALSRYSNFGFKQFATSGGNTFAITDDGLYELAGNTDEGETISAIMDLGANDYGSAQGKRMSSVYAGIHTDGDVYFRIAGDNGADVVYKAVDYGSESRARTAKGMSARHWRIGLEIVDASYADLDNVEVEIGVSKRRLLR